MPDRPVLGILRISPPKARELNLNSDQIIRGIVADDGKSVEFLLGNIKQEIRSNLEQWKGKAVEFKVNIDKNGSGPSGGTAIVSPEASLYQSLNPRHYLLHPKSLITLLSNPNYSQLEFLNKIQFGSLIDWLKSFYPSFSSTALLSSLIYSANKIDTSEIKRQLKNNGFTFASKKIVAPESNSLVTIKHAISILLENLGEKINSSDILGREDLQPKKYIVMSIHREENVDSPSNFTDLLESIDALTNKYAMPIVISTHPRTRKKLDEIGYQNKNPLIRFSKPYGFHDYNNLQMNAFCVISDSGTIAEEGSILNLPAVTIRQAHERPEGMDETTVIMSGLNKNRVLEAVEVATTHNKEDSRSIKPVKDYEADNVSKKILRIILSYTDYINRTVWHKEI